MPHKPRTPPAVASFGPELLAALLAGAKGTTTIPDVPYRKAIKLRQRIYQLREAMKRENHDMYAIASRVRAEVSWPTGTVTEKSSRNVEFPKDRDTLCTLTISPLDSQFADILRSGGIEAGSVGTEVLSGESSVDDALKDYAPKET